MVVSTGVLICTHVAAFALGALTYYVWDYGVPSYWRNPEKLDPAPKRLWVYEEDEELDDVLQETLDMYAPDPESLTEQVEKIEEETSLDGHLDSRIYAISEAEFSEDKLDYEKAELQVYTDDETVVDEDEDVVDDPQELVGDLVGFGGTWTTVYVRNDNLRKDFIVHRIEGAYAPR